MVTNPSCLDRFEDQMHLLIDCPAYQPYITKMTNKIIQIINTNRKKPTEQPFKDVKIPETNI